MLGGPPKTKVGGIYIPLPLKKNKKKTWGSDIFSRLDTVIKTYLFNVWGHWSTDSAFFFS